MFEHIVTQNILLNAVKQMIYDIIFTAPNNELGAQNFSDSTWYHYSNMSVSIMILITMLVRVFVGETDSTKWKAHVA